MTPVVQKEYEELFQTFSTEGWRLYIKSVEDLMKNLKDTALEDCNSLEELAYRKGQLSAFLYAMTVQFTTESMYKSLQEDITDEGN